MDSKKNRAHTPGMAASQLQDGTGHGVRCLSIYTIFTDADSLSREQLARILKPLMLSGQCVSMDRSQIPVGANRTAWLAAQHAAAELVLVLCSADLLADDQAQMELEAVLAHGRASILPIVVRPVELSLSPFLGGLRALPLTFSSIAEAPQQDRAWQQIQAELRKKILYTTTAHPGKGPQGRAARIEPRRPESLRKPLQTKWLGILGLLLLLSWYGLGEAALQARAELLGIDPDTFRYPLVRPLWEGVRVLPGMAWRIALLGGGAGAERSLWVVPVGLFAAPLLLVRWPRLRDASMGLSLAGVWLGSLALVVVVRIHHVALDDSEQAPHANLMNASVLDAASFELATWLRNGGDLNDKRRGGLVGLYGLGLMGSLGLCIQSLRCRSPGMLDRGYAVGLGLATLLLCTQAPRAYAIGRWGLLYRPVLALAPECSMELAAALANGTCTAWDVSDGAKPEVLLLRGSGCPTLGSARVTVLALRHQNPDLCVLSRGDSEPVLKKG